MKWRAWRELKDSHPTRIEYYLAQIALEVARVLHKHPKRLKLKHFLFDFTNPDKPKQKSKAQLELEAQKSKMAWLGAFIGFGKKKE